MFQRTLTFFAGGFVLAAGPFVYADVTGTVNGTSNVKAISPLIYGSNQSSVPSSSDRLGGNRWTAYNWENNASNAGSDYIYQNDDYLVSNLPTADRNKPGYAVRGTLNANASNGKATLLTVPINGYVSADKNEDGDVRNSGSNYLSTRFNQILPTKPGGNLSLTPNTTDDFVYADEFVNWVNNNKSAGQQVLYNLDNEPDLWFDTHPEVHPAQVTYEELAQRNIDFATAIKSVSPNASVLGAVNYGWTGYRTLQNAPGANGRDFQTYYLQRIHAANTVAGKRLVDAIDFHWYPEAQGTNGVRITGSDTSAATVAARLQAPRSLWDPTYIENSYITRDTLPTGDKAIKLLPRTQALINANDPGMKMAITEYNYGGGDHISGGIAQADVLGVYGKQGLYAANWWDLGSGSRFTNAAMRMYLNYDGQGGHFGDTSVGSTVSDDGTASVYASLDSTDPGKLTLVLINKSSAAQTLNLSLANLGLYTSGKAYQFNETSTLLNGIVQIGQLPNITLASPNNLSFLMSPLSVTTIALVPEPTTLAGLALAGILMRRRRTS